MKALKKLLFTGVILGTVSLMATSAAFAAGETATYDPATKTVAVAGVDYTAYADGSQLAVVVVPTSTYVSGSIASVTDDKIYYIDQAAKADASSAFATLYVKEGFAAVLDDQAEVKEYADGSYVALIGSNDSTQAIIAIPVTLPDLNGAAKTHEVKLGDPNSDGEITSSDAGKVLNIFAGLDTDSTSDQLIAADANRDSEITSSDAGKILNIFAGLDADPGVVLVDDVTGEIVE